MKIGKKLLVDPKQTVDQNHKSILPPHFFVKPACNLYVQFRVLSQPAGGIFKKLTYVLHIYLSEFCNEAKRQ